MYINVIYFTFQKKLVDFRLLEYLFTYVRLSRKCRFSRITSTIR